MLSPWRTPAVTGINVQKRGIAEDWHLELGVPCGMVVDPQAGGNLLPGFRLDPNPGPVTARWPEDAATPADAGLGSNP